MTQIRQEHLLVCRCEEIDVAEVRQAIAGGAVTVNDVKRRTRAGMGICQGIYCTETIARMIHEQAGVPMEALAPMTARPPARLIPVGVLADMEE